MKQLIATDFAGTFIKHGVIDPGYHTQIAAWRKSGRYFGFVTGRGLDFFNTIKEIGVTADYLLLYNGALLALPDGTVVKEYLIPRDTFRRLEEYFEKLPDNIAYSKTTDEEYYHQYYAQYETYERALEVAAEVNEQFGGEVTAFVNGQHVNIGKKGSCKAQGVRDALAHFGLSPDSAAVFGDDYNDLDMIVSLDGWAVDTARPEVLAAAPHICRTIGDVAETLMREENQI